MTNDIDVLDADIPDDIRAILGDAEAAYSDPHRADQAICEAVDHAPDNLSVRIAAYTFYFYVKRYADAIGHAEACLTIAAKALGQPADWRRVNTETADFSGFGRPQRVYLKSLVAIGYCKARLGDLEGGEAILRAVARFDPQDHVGAGRLADVIARRGVDPEDDEGSSDANATGAKAM